MERVRPARRAVLELSGVSDDALSKKKTHSANRSFCRVFFYFTLDKVVFVEYIYFVEFLEKKILDKFIVSEKGHSVNCPTLRILSFSRSANKN